MIHKIHLAVFPYGKGKITQLGAHLYTILNSYFYYALSCRNGDAVDSVIGRMGIMWP